MPESNTTAPAPQGAGEARPDLTAIVVTWNVLDQARACLEALHSPGVRENLTVETIIVDNASRDGTPRWAREWVATHEQARLIPLAKNLGYGRANNLGMAEARGRALLILNPDTLPQHGSLRALVSVLHANPRAGIVSPSLLNVDGSVQRAAFRFPTLLMHALDLFPIPTWLPGRARRWLEGSTLNGRYPQEIKGEGPFKIDHPLGACMLISRKAYEQVGGFDPAIFMYSEEIDLALRYRKAGWECYQVPTARVVHLGGASTRQMPQRMYVELWRSRFYVYRKHYQLPARIALSILMLVRQIWETMKLTVAGRSLPKDERRVRLATIRRLAALALGG